MFNFKKSMKRFKFLLILLTAAIIGVAATSCEPEEIDAFIDGFYEGYYGTTPPGGYY